MSNEQSEWMAWVGRETAELVTAGLPHAKAIETAYSEARLAFRRKHPELHVLPSYLSHNAVAVSSVSSYSAYGSYRKTVRS